MSWKDYVLLAEALLDARPNGNVDMVLHPERELVHRQWERDCAQIAVVLGRDNVNFNREWFLRACGVS